MYPYSRDGSVHPDAIQSFNDARHEYLPDSYPEVAEDSFEFGTIVDEDWRQTQLTMRHMPGVQNVFGRLHNLSTLITISTKRPDNTSSVKISDGESGGQDDASDSFEQKPESELASAENGADDYGFQKKS
ncbi:hypothetical protein MBLNU13_g05567t1 [Cladosporium sp. NU13]